MAEETLLSFGSESLARYGDVEDRDRLKRHQFQAPMQMQSTHIYCEALLELTREALARILNWGSSMLFVVVVLSQTINCEVHLSQCLLGDVGFKPRSLDPPRRANWILFGE
jgi:hypothetical protein